MARQITSTDVKEALADYFDYKADCREGLARRYPEDYRNEVCANSLRAVAKYVRELPDDDPRLARLAAIRVALGDSNVRSLFDEGVFEPPKDVPIAGRDFDEDDFIGEYSSRESQSDHQAFKCGFYGPIGQPGEWFAEWVSSVEAEAHWPPEDPESNGAAL
jgi:hypothetical protein